MSVPPHPDGVQPLGNLYLLGPAPSGGGGGTARRRRTGADALPPLDDAAVLLVLSYLDAPSLAAFGTAGVACAAFSRSEELWQALCCRPRCGGPDQKFRAFRLEPIPGYRGGSWRATYRAHALAAMAAAEADHPAGTMAAAEAAEKGKPTPSPSLPLQLPAVFSDALFKSHEIVHGPSAFGDGPSGPPIERVSRPISAEEFSATYESGAGRPVVLEPPPPTLASRSEEEGAPASPRIWDEEELRGRLGRRVFHAGGVNMRLADYLEYARTNRDEQPLYCFDPTFAATAPQLAEAYAVPEPFRDDLFSLLERDADGTAAAADPKKKKGTRPDYRWLLIGGPRSGQTWHKDPSGTSAWNLTLRGRKRWLMFPPDATPPGVVPSREGSRDYMTPISLAEWARGYYREALRAPGFLEAETKEGEVMYVPRGWWHMVLNVGKGATVAVSHHFLSPAGLSNTLRLLREAPHQVSGIDRGLAPRTASGGTADPARTAEEDRRRRAAAGRGLLGRLERALREHRPEALARAEGELRREREAAERKRERCSAKEELFRSRKKAFGAAATASGGVAAAPAPFAFNFA